MPTLVIANERNIPEAVGGYWGFRILSLFPGRAFLWFQRRFLQEKYVLVFRPQAKELVPEINTACSGEPGKRGCIYIVEPTRIGRKNQGAVFKSPANKDT